MVHSVWNKFFGEKDVDVGEKMGAITEEEFEAKKKQLLGQ